MDLKDFASETLLSIVTGVTEAQAKAQELSAHVNPERITTRNAAKVADNTVWDNSKNNYAQLITFDVAVTAEDTAKAGAKVKVIAGIFGLERTLRPVLKVPLLAVFNSWFQFYFQLMM